MPPRQTTRPASWRAAFDPAGLVEQDDTRRSHRAPELRPITDAGEEVEQVARLGGADARTWPPERAEARAGEPDRAMELREVERGRRLPDAPAGLRHDRQRDASRRRLAGGRRATCRACSPPYISVRSRPIDRIVSLTSLPPPLVEPPSITSSRFAASLSDAISMRLHQPVEPAARRRWPVDPRERRDRDRELEGRRRGKGRSRVPRRRRSRGEVLDVDRRGAGEPRREPPDVATEAPRRGAAHGDAVAPHAEARRRARRCDPPVARGRRPFRRAGEARAAAARRRSRTAGSAERTLRDDPTVDAHDDTARARRGEPLHEAVRRLVRRRPLDRRRARWRWRRGREGHARTVAFRHRADPRAPRPRRVLRRGRGARGPVAPNESRSSSAATRAAAASSRRRTTSRGASASARR